MMESNSLSVQRSAEIANTSEKYKNRLRRHTDTFDNASRFEECDDSLVNFPNSEHDTKQDLDKETLSPNSLPSTKSIDLQHQNKESVSPIGPRLPNTPRINYNSKDKVCVYTPL